MGTQLFLGKPSPHIEQVIIKRSLNKPLCFTAVDAGATISFDKIGSPNEAHIVTSVDKQNWTPYTFNTEITLTNVGDKIYFRAADENDISFYRDDNNCYRFTTKGKKIAASGNIQTLMKADGSRLDISEKINRYSKMFYGCTSLTTAPELPATTLAIQCYQSMFYKCSSLTTAPELPATTLTVNCYNSMFSYCSSLVTAPALPATTLARSCYSNMFSHCSSLVIAPVLLAITLARSCYSGMFSYCSSLVTAPVLRATILASGCYSSMFANCSSLTAAPALPATKLIDVCYYNMFTNCTKLSSINVNFSDWSPSDATLEWVIGVAESGTFTCPAALPDTRDASHIPTGWTRIEK